MRNSQSSNIYNQNKKNQKFRIGNKEIKTTNVNILLNRVRQEKKSSKKKRIILKGDVPSPINPPSGCVFRTRCPTPTHDCKEGNIDMGLIEVSPGHWVDQCCVNCG